ncbi:phosphate ABC transporter substrate-binding protein PstS [Ottowia thiooxydans]|uniref:phosphate ABC transporter substrate-binding protein PstS n=1 Tax=Ottowia thiooxydans TaxID=219182 RepID=UPI000421C73B|nr:phosphate ABC transporter substrate-binding protein PstS [Ottowia thiooxydans]
MPTKPTYFTARRRLLQLAGTGALAGFAAPLAFAQDEYGQALLKGAGSTFVQPLIQQWIKQYRDGQLGAHHAAGNAGLDGDMLGRAALDYEAIGSLAGLQRLQAKAVDFAFSELPLSGRALSAQGLLQAPIVLGGVAIVAHVPGLKAPLRLDGATLAAIYRNRIKSWNDPAIAALNPGATLPALAIVPVHRIEGSGTTYTLTRYLSTQDTEWRDAVGVDAVVGWPGNVSARGSSGMARTVSATSGAIGYLDAVQASAARLSVVQLKNAAGHFVVPNTAAIEAAARSSPPWRAEPGQDELPTYVNAPGSASYPIAATVLAVLNQLPAKGGDRRARNFLAWALANGQSSARNLGYVALPASTAQQVRAQLQLT